MAGKPWQEEAQVTEAIMILNRCLAPIVVRQKIPGEDTCNPVCTTDLTGVTEDTIVTRQNLQKWPNAGKTYAVRLNIDTDALSECEHPRESRKGTQPSLGSTLMSTAMETSATQLPLRTRPRRNSTQVRRTPRMSWHVQTTSLHLHHH